MKLETITPAMVNRAVDIYLRHAYSDNNLRKAHAVHFDEDGDIETALASWERDDASMRAYTLRLGCEHYPHMKLALWEAYRQGEFVFAVDRHDGFDFDRDGPGFDSWVGVKSKNFRARAAIEEEFYEAGLPTMRRLKEEKLSESDILREFSGKEVLVVDNDIDACAIMSMILQAEGYGCRMAGSVAEVEEVLQDKSARDRCGMALVDLLLTDGSGIQVVRKLRMDPVTREIPIVFTSAMNPRDVSLGEVDGYLHKPYSADDLIETVKSALCIRFEPHE